MSYKVELTILLDEKPNSDNMINVVITDSCMGGAVYYGDVDHVGEITEVLEN